MRAFRPKPFQRPGIEIGSRPTKEWRDIPAGELSEGDRVAHRGQVIAVDADLFEVSVEFFDGTVERYERDQKVNAFTQGAQSGVTG